MLAHAFLAVVRADEHTRRPGPADLVPLSCNEIQRLFITLVSSRSTTQLTGSAGPTGDAATKPGPAPAITSDRPHPRHEDHDLQLEY